MKIKFLFLIIFFALLFPIESFADLNGSGWYRVQNRKSSRYVGLIDNEGSATAVKQDFHAMQMINSGDELSDPYTVIYIKASGSQWDLQACGTGLYSMSDYYMKFDNKGTDTINNQAYYDAYIPVVAFFITVNAYVEDQSGFDKAGDSYETTKWFLKKIDTGSGGDTYFGVAPTENDKIGEYYYTTLRTAFSYKLSANVDAFTIDANGVLSQLPHSNVVPINTPVILRCQSTNPSDNRIYPQEVGTKTYKEQTSTISSSLVKGTVYDYFKSSIVNAAANVCGSYTKGTEYAFGTAYNDNIRVLSVENGKLGFFKTFHEAYPSDLCLNGRLAYYNLKAANNDDNGGLTLLETPSLAPSTAETLVGGTISFTASKLSPKGGILQYKIDEGEWIDVTGTTVTFNVTSDVPKSGKVYARTINCGCPSNVVEATYTFTALSAPSITPASAEAEVGETITFTATNPNGGSSTMQYRIDGGAWTTTTGTITVTSNEAKTGTVEVKVINGNAESSVASATYTFAEAYQDITLANLVNKPVDDTKYNITDLTCINVIDNAGLLICKDDKGYAPKDVTENGWIDYMQQVSGLTVPHEYDQSNWIALRLPQGESLSSDMILKPLTGVKGHLVNATNLEFQLDVKPQFGSRVEFTPNTYIPASFKGTQESPVTGKTYFFVQPKPMEYAHIEWAVSRGDKFITSPRDIEHGINTAGLSGEFEFNGMYLGDFGLERDHVYKMDAIIKLFTDNFDHAAPSAKAPRLADAQAQARYIVYPVTIQQTSESVITGVMNVAGVREVAAVEYVNLAGQRSSRPWQGVNIVITRYTDGTVTTAKECK